MSSIVNVIYNSESIIESLTIQGHAGIKKSGEGYEVCIALSTLSQALYRASLVILGKRFLKYKIDDGLLSLELIHFDKLESVFDRYKIFN